MRQTYARGGRARSPAHLKTRLSQLVLDARKEPQRQEYISTTDIMPAVHVLRGKGFSWLEITEWFSTRKMHWTLGALANTYKAWLPKQKATPP